MILFPSRKLTIFCDNATSSNPRCWSEQRPEAAGTQARINTELPAGNMFTFKLTPLIDLAMADDDVAVAARCQTKDGGITPYPADFLRGNLPTPITHSSTHITHTTTYITHTLLLTPPHISPTVMDTIMAWYHSQNFNRLRAGRS